MALFKNNYGEIVATGFINCGWVVTPDAVLNSVPEAYRNSKINSQIKNGVVPDGMPTETVERFLSDIEKAEKHFGIELFLENWENQWVLVEAYDFEILRDELIKLNKDDLTVDKVVDNMLYRYGRKNSS